MSFKRPTEVSWDSDEDEELLNFNSKFKADDDEELDEEALLGSDEELSFSDGNAEIVSLASEGKSSNAAVNKISSTTFKKPNSVSSNNKTSHTNLGKGIGDTGKARQSTPKSFTKPSNKSVPDVYNEPEPVLLLDPEESYDFDDSGVTDAILDSSQGEESEDHFVKPHSVISVAPTQTTSYSGGQAEEEGGEDPSDVSVLEISVDQGNESSDESDDSDDEHGRRRRFKMERQGSIKLPTHKSGTDIPDTLEISKEQEKEIEQFMHHGQNKSKFQRGRGRGNFYNARGQQRMGLNRGQRLGYPANQNNRNNHLPPAFPHEAQLNQIRHQGSSPPASKPQKIHINPHFRPGNVAPPRHGDGLMATPAIPPMHRPTTGPPSLLNMHTQPPIMHSAPQSVPWGHQPAPQPMFSKPQPMHQVPNRHPHHQFPSQQPPPGHGVPYSDYSRGPPSYPPQGQPPMRPPHVPHSRPPTFHGQEFPPRSQFSHSGPPHPQPLVPPQRHQYPHPQHPPQPLMRGEPHPPHQAPMRPPSQQPPNGPPQGGHPHQHPQYGPPQQPYPQQRYPSPDSHGRPNFPAPHQQQQQAPPGFHHRAPGFQNQLRPQRFPAPGERMPHNLNNNNNGLTRNPVAKQKQTVLLAHAKKLKERAKKFGQNPQSTPAKPLIKPLKRPSTANIGTEEVSPVKQIKVEPEVPLTPEDRELQEKLALQARQRELIRQRKEANRQALAQKKREQLAQRLTNQGQTLEDIEQPSTANVLVNPLHTGLGPAGNQAQPGGQGIQANQGRPQIPQVSRPNQNAQRKVVTPGLSAGNKAAIKTTPTMKSPNKKAMKRIETVKKNSQGEIISREIKLVPIEDETDAIVKTSVLNQGQVQVVKTSAPVAGISVNRSVISPLKNMETPSRSVIRLGNTQAQEKEGGDMRNVVSQQTSGRRIVVTSKPKSVLVKNLSTITSDTVIKSLCSSVGPVQTVERKQKDVVVTFMDGIHASKFVEKYNRSLLDLSTIHVSLIHH